MQVPDFALIILYALGKGGGKDNGDDVPGSLMLFNIDVHLNYWKLQMNAHPVEKMLMYSALLVSLPTVIPVVDCGILIG